MLFVRNQLSLLAVEASTRLGCMLGRLCMLIEMGRDCRVVVKRQPGAVHLWSPQSGGVLGHSMGR
jgi:hypothetical protein